MRSDRKLVLLVAVGGAIAALTGWLPGAPINSDQWALLKAGNVAPLIFGLALIFVFLFLAAQYESWTLPFVVLLAVPLAVLGAVVAVQGWYTYKASPAAASERDQLISRIRAAEKTNDDLRSQQLALEREGFGRPKVRTVLSPAWTTDWMTEEGKAKLKAYAG